jgi:nitroreductase
MTIDLAALDELLAGRHSVRGFSAEPVPRTALMQIFAVAQRAPSWCNIQPWRVVVTEPPATHAVRAGLVAAATTRDPHPDMPFPVDYPEPYLGHRRACGLALYGAMGIARTDQARRHDAWLRNFQLFDAPHLAVVSVDGRLGPYAMLDIGVWLGLVVTAAAAMGVSTCPLASIAAYPEPLRSALPIGPDQQILFGIAIGFANDNIAANQCRTGRAPLDANVTFVT